MPRYEKKIKIESSPEKIYNIVVDDLNRPKWNPAVSGVIELENDKVQLSTDLGGFTIINSETEENKSVTWHVEESDTSAYEYILNPKPKVTEVFIWFEFDDKKLLKLFKKMADLSLMGLKNYIDFIEKGGNTKLYNKWELMVTP